jgi:Fe-S-cluster-containing dehydrogenase component
LSTGASHYSDGGIVLVEAGECIGCGACIASCPYDARYPHPEGYVDKCTFCIHRIKSGMKPACVEVCPTKCLYFGDLDDLNSDVTTVLKERKYKTLIPEAGTEPQLYFLI